MLRINKSVILSLTHFRLGRAFAILTVLMLAVAIAWASGARPTVKTLGDGLICQCGGCNFPVSTCNHEQCSSRDEMKAMAAKEIASGKDETTILQDFVLRYGVKVLSTPPASGFNLSVWVLPGVGLVVGLGVVISLARRWRKPSPPPVPADAQVDPATRAAIEEEMKTSGLEG